MRNGLSCPLLGTKRVQDEDKCLEGVSVAVAIDQFPCRQIVSVSLRVPAEWSGIREGRLRPQSGIRLMALPSLSQRVRHSLSVFTGTPVLFAPIVLNFVAWENEEHPGLPGPPDGRFGATRHGERTIYGALGRATASFK
jgi:hypothetical protein